MVDAGLRIVYIEDLPSSFFEEFEAVLDKGGIGYESETRPNESYAGLEGYLPAAIAIYLVRPFVDDYLKRAAKDVNDVLYPRTKEALAKLLKRVFVSHRDLKVVATLGKVRHPEATILAFHTRTNAGREAKFVFLQTLDEEDYPVAVESLLGILREHFDGSSPSDPLSTAPAEASWKPILMAYDPVARAWRPYDPTGNRSEA